MKNIIKNLLLIIVVILLACSCFTSCVSKNDAKYKQYDSTGQPYDFYIPDYVDVVEYSNIKLPKLEKIATETDVNNKLKYYQALYCSSIEDPDRPCQNGDIVDIITECKFTDNDEVYNLYTFTRNSNDFGQSFVLGINYFYCEAIDENVLGMKIGETKTVKFNLPDPFYKDIVNSGREVELTIYLNYIDDIQYDEVEDNSYKVNNSSFYIENYGYDLNNFLAKIENDLNTEYSNLLKDYKVELAWDYVYNNSIIKSIPEDIYKSQYDLLINEARQNAIDKEKTLLEYVNSLGYDTLDDYYSYIDSYTNSIISEKMILYYIVRCENLTLSDEFYQEKLLELAKDYQITDLEQAEDFFDYYYGIDNVKEELLLQYAKQWIADNSIIVDDVNTVYHNDLNLVPSWEK